MVLENSSSAGIILTSLDPLILFNFKIAFNDINACTHRIGRSRQIHRRRGAVALFVGGLEMARNYRVFRLRHANRRSSIRETEMVLRRRERASPPSQEGPAP